jgi:hypothetical protein
MSQKEAKRGRKGFFNQLSKHAKVTKCLFLDSQQKPPPHELFSSAKIKLNIIYKRSTDIHFFA